MSCYPADIPVILFAYARPSHLQRTLACLRGDAAATAKVAKEFKVFYAKSAGGTPEAYSMDHTAGSYVFDANGKIRLFVRHGKGASAIAQDIKLLLN